MRESHYRDPPRLTGSAMMHSKSVSSSIPLLVQALALVFAVIFQPVTFAALERLPAEKPIIQALAAQESAPGAVQHAEVIVIGAGVAGLTAARQLIGQGIDVLVLEGRQRTGGRMDTFSSSTGLNLDLGCSFIHGIDASSDGSFLTNPIWDIARAHGIEVSSVSDRDFVARNSRGVLDPQLNSALELSFPFRENLTDLNNHAPCQSNLSLQDVLQDFMRSPAYKNAVKDNPELAQTFGALIYSYYENGNAESAQNLNAFYEAQTGMFYGHWAIFKDGYQKISDVLAKDIVKHITTGVNVTSIAYDSIDNVTISTSDGATFRAEYVIVTVPLGVLKKGNIAFSPPLPSWKQKAIETIGWGLLDKVYYIFEKAFWSDKSYFIVRVSPAIGEWTLWVNMQQVFGEPVLACLNTGSFARTLGMLPDAEVFSQGLAVLREMFGSSAVDSVRLKEQIRTNWGHDPFAWGSYSASGVHQDQNAIKDLSLPVDDRVFWAGEATSSYPGYTHGALLSGQREASRLLFKHLLPSKSVA